MRSLRRPQYNTNKRVGRCAIGGGSTNVLYIAPHDSGFNLIDLRWKVHLGIDNNFEREGITQNINPAMDAWAYAKTVSSRDATYDGYMDSAYGQAYSTLNATYYKDHLFAYMKKYNLPF